MSKIYTFSDLPEALQVKVAALLRKILIKRRAGAPEAEIQACKDAITTITENWKQQQLGAPLNS